MSSNPYAPPVAVVQDVLPEASLSTEPVLYVVSRRKFAVLFFTTLGMYQWYWFYRNWRLLKREDPSIWPWPRTCFNIFFIHSLFRHVARIAKKDRVSIVWDAGSHARFLVFIKIIHSLFDRLSVKSIWSPWTDIIDILLLIPLWHAFDYAQVRINKVSGDPNGSSNDRFTTANKAWIATGGLLMILAIIGFIVS